MPIEGEQALLVPFCSAMRSRTNGGMNDNAVSWKAFHSRRRAGEVFSYLVLRKPDGIAIETRPYGRILSSPLKRDKHVIVEICSPNGSIEKRVYSKGKLKDNTEKYRMIRKGEWGGILSE